MTIKKLAVVVASFLFSLLFLSIIWGKDGYLVTRSLAIRYEELKRREELYSVELESLQKQIDRSRDSDYLDDIALSLGYKGEGEKVYYFEKEDEQAPAALPRESVYHYELYEGEPLSKLALISLFASFVIFCIYSVISLVLGIRRERTLIFSDTPKKRKRTEIERKNSYDDIGF